MEQARIELGNLPASYEMLERVAKAEGCPQVMGVHDHMCQGIHPSAIPGGSICNPVMEQVSPNHWYGHVVVDVQEGKLLAVLLQNDPQSIKPIQELGKVVHEHEPFALSIKLRVDAEHIGKRNARHQTIDHVRAQNDLNHIVDLHVQLHLRSLPCLLIRLALACVGSCSTPRLARQSIHAEHPKHRQGEDDNWVHQKSHPRDVLVKQHDC